MRKTVERKVYDIVTRMGVTYLYDDWRAANVRLENKTLPAIVYILPASGSVDVRSREIKDMPECFISFMDKVGFDANGEDVSAVVERMKDLMFEFIERVNASGEFDKIGGELSYEVFYDKLDIDVAGVVLDVKLRETNGVQRCKIDKR